MTTTPPISSLADTDRESGDYDDDDYYWEYENAYVDGRSRACS